jgi:hypothetical protein
VIYRHGQFGRVYVVVLALVAAACLSAGFVMDLGLSAIGAFTLVAAICIAFARLAIDVDGTGLRWHMTFGFPGGTIPLEEIVSAEIVPVSFWMGIGIHLSCRGWVWNVALGRGVQIHRCGAMPVVLGTDDPEALLAAIGRVHPS